MSVYSVEKIRSFLQEGESKTVEFKLKINEPDALARLIAAFANTSGGVILVGVREPAEIVGCDTERLKSVLERAVSITKPAPETALDFVDVDGKPLAVITVKKSADLILTNAGAFLRVGESVRAMPAPDISRALSHHRQIEFNEIQPLAESLSNLTSMVEDLQKKLQSAQSFKFQITNYLISGVVGAIISWLVGLYLK